MSKYKRNDLIRMDQNTNYSAKNRNVREKLIEIMKEENWMKYPDPTGFQELKELVLEDMGITGEVEITAGATPALELIFRTLLKPDDEIITTDPGYLMIDSLAERYGKVVRVDVWKERQLTMEHIFRNLTPKTKMILLVDPTNPFGETYTREDIKEIATFANSLGLIVLHDITYKDFPDEHYKVAAYAPHNTITVFSFSKTYGLAGLRIGGIITTPERMKQLRPNVIDTLGVNAIAQEMAIAALENKETIITQVRAETRCSRDYLIEELKQLGFRIRNVSEASMMVVEVPNTLKVTEMDERLQGQGVYFRAGQYTSKLHGDQYFRISFSQPLWKSMKFMDTFKEVIRYLRR